MRTPIHQEHIDLGAKMTEFAGWEMPLYYSGIVREVNAVRSAAGVFDLSHMGEIIVSGPRALELLQVVTTNDAASLRIGGAQYTLMCDENAGIIDDLIVYRLDNDEYMLVVNASNTDSDFRWIVEHNNVGAECRDMSRSMGLLAIQGPESAEILQPLLGAKDLSRLERFTIERARVGEIEVWVARTGYTGEDGFELYCDSSDCVDLWRLFVRQERKTTPIGLGARDVLRLEAGYPLYGHELTRDINPVEAGLMWVVKPSKGDFLGRQAILNVKDSPPERVLAGLVAVDKCIPRHGEDVYVGGQRVGFITSGTFSPTINAGIGMAYVEPEYGVDETALYLMVRGRLCACRVVSPPFYRQKKQAKGVASDS